MQKFNNKNIISAAAAACCFFMPSLSASDKILWEGAKSLTTKAPKAWSNPHEIDTFRLGKRIFFDKTFSKGGSFSCASCHNPAHHFTDNRRLASATAMGLRNTPSIVNSMWSKWFFLDGRADSLVSQALMPFEHPNEHATHRFHVFAVVASKYKDTYQHLFGPLGPGELLAKATRLMKTEQSLLQRVSLASTTSLPSMANSSKWAESFDALSDSDKNVVNRVFVNVGVSLATYQRSLVSLNAPFDQFLQRWKGAGAPEKFTNETFSPAALNGLRHFLGKAGCVRCHNGPMLSDQEFYNVGFSQTTADRGRFDGIKQLAQQAFSCDHDFFKGIPWVSQSEACKEKSYLSSDVKDYLGAFKTPSLRDVAKTAPYGHQGTFKTLEKVLEHYNEPKALSHVGHLNPMLVPLGLTRNELNELSVFLHSLSGDVQSLAGETFQ